MCVWVVGDIKIVWQVTGSKPKRAPGGIKIVWQVTGSKPKRALARLCSLSAFWVAGGIKIVWAVLDSNQRPPQCQCDALPPALTAQTIYNIQFSELRWYRMRYILKSQAKRLLRALTAQTIYNIQFSIFYYLTTKIR